MSNPTGWRLSWRNYVFTDLADTVEVYEDLSSPGAAVTVGSIADLRDSRLSKRATMRAEGGSDDVVTLVLRWERDGASFNPVEVGAVGLLNYSLALDGIESVTWNVVVIGANSGTSTNTVTIVERPSEDFPSHLWRMLGTAIEDAYEVRIVIEGTAGSEGGSITLTCGALWIGPTWEAPEGVEAFWSQTIVDPGRMQVSTGRQGYAQQRQRYRSLTCRPMNVSVTQAYGDPDDASAMDIQQLIFRTGTTTPIALFQRTVDASGELSPHLIHRLGIYGHFEDAGQIEHLGDDRYQWSGIRVAELM